MLGPRAVLHEDVTVSAAQLRCGNVIVLQRVVIDALVETGAHIPAGVHISQAVPPLACDAPAKKPDLQCEEDNGCADHERRPLLPWLLAVFTRGVGAALCDAALLGFTLATYLCLGLPSSGNHLAILEELVLVTPSWKILLFSMVVLAITVILRPLMFTAWLVGVRRVFIRPVADGDRASHSAGSIFLELALRSEEVRMIDGMCGLLHRTWVARVFGLRVAARGFLPLPKLDRPELVSVGEGSYIGGGNTLCTRQVDASGASYQQICIGCDSFLANGTVLMPSASFGPRAVLGNRSLGIAGEEYNDAVFMGQKGESESAGGGAGLVTMGGNRRQSDQTRVSAVRLMTMRGGQHLAPGELPEEPSSPRGSKGRLVLFSSFPSLALPRSVPGRRRAYSFRSAAAPKTAGLEHRRTSRVFPSLRAGVALAVVPRGDSDLQVFLSGLLPRGKARKARLARCSGAKHLHFLDILTR